MPYLQAEIQTFAEAQITGTLYVALLTKLPAADGTGATEFSGGAYARQSVTAWASTLESDGTVWRMPDGHVAFPEATADWPGLLGWGLYDASSGGNIVAWGEITNSAGDPTVLTVQAGETLTFRDTNLRIGIGGRAIRVPQPQEDALQLTNTKTSTYTGAVNELVPYDASGGTFPINFPADPLQNDRFGVIEVGESQVGVTLNGNGSNVVDPSDLTTKASYSFTNKLQSLFFVYDGTVWRLA